MKRPRARAFSLAGRAIRSALGAVGATDRSSQRPGLTFMGRGLSRTGVAMAEPVGRGDESFDFIALVPHELQEVPDLLCPENEARLLHALDGELGAIRVPRGARVVEVEGTPILVMERVWGMALDPRQGAACGMTPWEVTAQAAATVHKVAPENVAWLGGCATWRDHGLESLQRAREQEHRGRPEARDAIAWMEDHLPADEGSRLLHGDLLGQNILLQLELSSSTIQAIILIDWAGARLGDPAYDLAITTRGVRRPFQESGGLEKLLDAYSRHGGGEITVAQVRFHEVAMLLEWHAKTLVRPDGAAQAQDLIQRVPALLR